MKVLSDLDVLGKKVFLRGDLDIPISNLGIEESTRLNNLKPTVEYLLEHDAQQIFIAGHIDRPREPGPELSTSHLEAPLEAVLRRSVTYKRDFNLDDGMLSSMAQIILFENLRFWPGEEKNDLEFAEQLAKLADIYVNDAFATCHRIHASIVALPSLLPHAAGLHLDREVKVLEGLLTAPKRPFVVIIGGAKIETKVPVIANLAKIADWVLVGGEIAKEVQSSKFKVQSLSDKVIVATLTSDTKDIDSPSINKFKSIISDARTIIWNGPMGVFEEGFEKGTVEVANAIIDSGAYAVVGGGETTQFLASKNLLSRFSSVSSGGGAMLAFLAGKELPGIKALE